MDNGIAQAIDIQRVIWETLDSVGDGLGGPSLRHRRKRKSYPRVAFFSSVRGEKHAPCGACAGDSKGRAYRPGPLRIYWLLPLRGSFARLRRAFVVLIRFRLSKLLRCPMRQSLSEWWTPARANIYGAQCISPCPIGGPDPGTSFHSPPPRISLYPNCGPDLTSARATGLT